MASTTHDVVPRAAEVREGVQAVAGRAYMNPYLAGIGLGLVLLASFVVMGRGLGASGAFSAAVAWALNAVAPGYVAQNEYLSPYIGDGSAHPLKAWLVFEVMGVFAGALLSGLLAGRVKRVVEKGPRVSNGRASLLAFVGGMSDGDRRGPGPRLHERPGADGRRPPERRELGLHDVRLRRRLRRRLALQEGMEMTAPFFKYGLFGDEASLLVAFVIGIGFGFFLERAGFGSARKLVAQFYLTDLAVFKVMFTAIVTAMLGVTYLAWMGILDLSLVYLVPTYWVAQVVGGLLLGVGFVVGGYCPGTSVAAVATGKIDGLFYVLGIVAGTLTFAGLFPLLRGLYLAGSAGTRTLPGILHLPYGVVVFAVVLMALGGFYGAGLLETRFARQGEGLA